MNISCPRASRHLTPSDSRESARRQSATDRLFIGNPSRLLTTTFSPSCSHTTQLLNGHPPTFNFAPTICAPKAESKHHCHHVNAMRRTCCHVFPYVTSNLSVPHSFVLFSSKPSQHTSPFPSTFPLPVLPRIIALPLPQGSGDAV